MKYSWPTILVYSSYVAEQWGIFILSIFYTYAWIKGIKTYWIKKGLK